MSEFESDSEDEVSASYGELTKEEQSKILKEFASAFKMSTVVDDIGSRFNLMPSQIAQFVKDGHLVPVEFNGQVGHTNEKRLTEHTKVQEAFAAAHTAGVLSYAIGDRDALKGAFKGIEGKTIVASAASGSPELEKLKTELGISKAGNLAALNEAMEKGTVKLKDKTVLIAGAEEASLSGLAAAMKGVTERGGKVLLHVNPENLNSIKGPLFSAADRNFGSGKLAAAIDRLPQYNSLTSDEFKKIFSQEQVSISESKTAARSAAVNDFLASNTPIGQKVIITDGVYSAQDMNTEIRESLREKGELAEGKKFNTQYSEKVKVQLTDFVDGEGVVATQDNNKKGIKKGDFGVVTAAEPNAIRVKWSDGKQVMVNAPAYVQHAYAIAGWLAPEKEWKKTTVYLEGGNALSNANLGKIINNGGDVNIFTSNKYFENKKPALSLPAVKAIHSNNELDDLVKKFNGLSTKSDRVPSVKQEEKTNPLKRAEANTNELSLPTNVNTTRPIATPVSQIGKVPGVKMDGVEMTGGSATTPTPNRGGFGPDRADVGPQNVLPETSRRASLVKAREEAGKRSDYSAAA